jgi:glycosyltransferase involved in cell wall biosynthesis
MKVKYSIIIPTKNEEEAIAKVICSIPKEIEKQAEIIVVDSSNDFTPIIAERLGAKVVKVKKEGKGYAMKVGAKAARGDILIFLDGDGTDPPQYIPRLLKKLNKYDLVLGARNLSVKGSDKKYKALFGAYLPLVQAFFKLLGFTTKGDPLAGFRVMRRDVWNALNLKTNDFLIETEMNLRAIELGLKVGEVPIPILSRGGGVLKSKLVRRFDQWIKIFNFGVGYIKDVKLKKKLRTLKDDFLKFYLKISNFV